MITIKNTESIEAITSVNGVEIDNILLAEGNPNARVLDIDLKENDFVEINEFGISIESKVNLEFDFSTAIFTLS
jgi:hypothetical protein